MYKVTCDGFPLLDFRDDELIIVSPKVIVEANKVGSGSFKIYDRHPHFDKLKTQRNIIEASDEFGVVFRGRMTEDSTDFENGKAIDLEGVLAFLNDSIIRPFKFPGDFLNDEGYIAAAKSGNVVRFFLEWIVAEHNSQVEPFQRFKVGNVTVSDPNNYITRSDSNYNSAWKTASEKLFNSALGGYLCIRYEDDGNYIDYLSEFTEVNTQGIRYGENLLDMKRDTNSSETYSAIIPLGSKQGKVDAGSESRLTIIDYPDGDIDDDIVKSGDTLYSRTAVANHGWKYAPVEDTLWIDVTTVENLVDKGCEYLSGKAIKTLSTIEVSAADLHYSDSQIRSFRIYKKIRVDSYPHGINEGFDLTRLELDLLNPQNTKITTGATKLTLTDYNGKEQGEIKDIVVRVSATETQVAEAQEQIAEVQTQVEETHELLVSEVARMEAKIEETDEGILLSVSQALDNYTAYVEGELELKIGRDENDQIVSMLNASANVINITSNRLTIESDHFSLSANGTVVCDGITARNGDFSGTFTNSNGLGTLEISGAMVSATQSDTTNSSFTLWSGHLNLTNGSWDITYGPSGFSVGSFECNAAYTDGSVAFVGTDNYIRFAPEQANLAGTWTSDAAVAVTSDADKKHEIRDITEAYGVIFDNLKPRLYKYNDGTSNRIHVGFVAQEVEAAILAAGLTTQDFAAFVRAEVPNVETGETETVCLLRYEEFIALNTLEIQKLKAKEN